LKRCGLLFIHTNDMFNSAGGSQNTKQKKALSNSGQGGKFVSNVNDPSYPQRTIRRPKRWAFSEAVA